MVKPWIHSLEIPKQLPKQNAIFIWTDKWTCTVLLCCLLPSLLKNKFQQNGHSNKDMAFTENKMVWWPNQVTGQVTARALKFTWIYGETLRIAHVFSLDSKVVFSHPELYTYDSSTPKEIKPNNKLELMYFIFGGSVLVVCLFIFEYSIRHVSIKSFLNWWKDRLFFLFTGLTDPAH